MAGFFHPALRDAVVGHLTSGTSVDVLGQKSAGRSEVLSACREALLERDWRVVVVRGVAALQDRPLEALAMAGLARRTDQQQGESAVSAAVNRVDKAVADGRTVLAVDDADDLDHASAGAIVAAHARRHFPVLTVSRPRPPQARDPFALPADVRPGVQLEVPALDYVRVHTLLTEVLGGTLDPDVVSRIDTASGGLPGLVVAIATAARGDRSLRVVDGVWFAGADLWSPALARSTDPLVSDVPPASLAALEMLALAGTVALPTAVELVGWDALEDLDACGLLRFIPQGDQVIVAVHPPLIEERFRHQRLGARRLHFSARMTRLLAPDDGDAQGSPAGPPGAWAPTDLPTPADARVDGMGLLPADDPSDAVLDRLLRDQWHREMLVRRREWEREPSPRTASAYLRVLLVGDAPSEVMHDVIERTPRSDDPREMVSFYRWQANVRAQSDNDPDGARELLHRAADEVGPWRGLLEALDDHITVLFDRIPPSRPHLDPTSPAWEHTHQFVDAGDCEILLHSGDPDHALAILDDAGWSDPNMGTLHQVLTGLARIVAGDVRGSLEWSGRHLARARADLDPDALAGLAYTVASALIMLGRVREVRTLLGRVLSIDTASAMQRHYLASLTDIAAVLAQDGGHLAAAKMLTDKARRTATSRAGQALPSSAWMMPRYAVDDDPEAVRAARFWANAEELADRGYLVSAVALASAAIELDPTPERVAAIRRMAGTAPARLVAVAVRVAETTTDPDPTAGARLSGALIDDGLVLLGVRAALVSVRRLREDGRAAEAAAILTEASGALNRAGADADVLLGSLAGASPLTRREREVGALVADGLSNGQIAGTLGITVKTVENHVNHLMRKLGATSRAGVAVTLPGTPPARTPRATKARGGGTSHHPGPG